MKEKQPGTFQNTSAKASVARRYLRSSGASVVRKTGRNYLNYMRGLMLTIGWYVIQRRLSMRRWKHASKPKRL